MRNRVVFNTLGLAVGLALAGAAQAESIKVGHIAAYTGRTSDVGQPYGQGIEDALRYINANGGINGKSIEFETVDYAYNAPEAIATYKRWLSGMKPVAIQGWGTADTEALVQFVAKDKVFFMSASYSGHLTDPMGKSEYTKVPAPYNFFYGPSYTDGCRGMVQFAMEDWKEKGGEGTPKFVYMGDNNPYPNAPKPACEAYAEELGFDVLPAMTYSLLPGDFKAQCLSLKDSGAQYAMLGNTSGSNISLVQSCETVGVDVQFLSNIWGWEELADEAAQGAGDGIAWVVGAADWTSDAPGMATVREVSKISDPSGNKARPLHYMRAVCGAFLMRDAMKMVDDAGQEMTGESIKGAMESMIDYVPADLEGVCLPSTWTPEDHRGSNQVLVYQSKGGEFEHVYTATIERKPEWLGW